MSKRGPTLTKAERRARAQTAAVPEQLYADWAGQRVPIPFVAAWSTERLWRLAPDPVIGGKLAVFLNGKRGEGRPLFGKMDFARQRLVIAKQLCQICAHPLGNDAWAVMFIEGEALGGYVLREPAACLPCMKTAIQLCPGIHRNSERSVVKVTRWSSLIAITDMQDERASRDPADTGPLVHAIGYAKFVVQDGVQFSQHDVLGM